MAKEWYRGVSGVARKVTTPCRGVGGVARKVTKGYRGVSGVARQFFAAGTLLNTLPVGTIVQVNENGTLVDYILVHLGSLTTVNSANNYENADGAWLLRKDLLAGTYYRNINTYYVPNLSDIATADGYVNTTFFSTLSSNVQSLIKEVRVPLPRDDFGTLTVKAFLPSASELGLTEKISGWYYDGDRTTSPLSYFSGADSSKRIALQSGTADAYWTRSVMNEDEDGYVYGYFIGTSGAFGNRVVGDGYGGKYCVRPCFIVPSETTLEQLLI